MLILLACLHLPGQLNVVLHASTAGALRSRLLSFIVDTHGDWIGIVKLCVICTSTMLLSNDISFRDAIEKSLFVALVFAPIKMKTANTQTLKAARVQRYWKKRLHDFGPVYANWRIWMKIHRLLLCTIHTSRLKDLPWIEVRS